MTSEECSITLVNHIPTQNYTFGQNDWTLAALKCPDPEIIQSIISHRHTVKVTVFYY